MTMVVPHCGGTSRTVVRRMQRIHSRVCYKEMSNKLICLVKPISSGAIQAGRLEKFRAMLYQPAIWESLPAAVSEPMHIDWCSAAWDLCEDDLSISKTKEIAVDPLETDASALRESPLATDTISDLSTHVACTMDAMNNMLQPTTCEAVMAARGIEPDLDRQLRQQRAAALKARWVNRPYTGLSWLDEVT